MATFGKAMYVEGGEIDGGDFRVARLLLARKKIPCHLYSHVWVTNNQHFPELQWHMPRSVPPLTTLVKKGV